MLNLFLFQNLKSRVDGKEFTAPLHLEVGTEENDKVPSDEASGDLEVERGDNASITDNAEREGSAKEKTLPLEAEAETGAVEAEE